MWEHYATSWNDKLNNTRSQKFYYDLSRLKQELNLSSVNHRMDQSENQKS